MASHSDLFLGVSLCLVAMSIALHLPEQGFEYVDKPVQVAPHPAVQPSPEQRVLTGVPGVFKCRTVAGGDRAYKVNKAFEGFHSSNTMTVQITLTKSAVSYSYPGDDPNGYRCATAWNFLLGGARCGYLTQAGQSSDRFAWRRHPSCLVQSNSSLVNSTATNVTVPANASYVSSLSACAFSDAAQLAAYAYDEGVGADARPSTLLAVFDTVLKWGEIYTLRLEYSADQTVYILLAGDGITTLETKTIQHTFCYEHKLGGNLDLLWGTAMSESGPYDCAAPHDVGICYSSDPGTWATDLWQRSHVV